MTRNCKPQPRRRVAGLVFCATLAAACSSRALDTPPPTISPAKPADSPPVVSRPPGVVLPLRGHPQAAMFDAGTSRLTLLYPSPEPTAPATITVLDAAQPPQAIALPGPATGLTGDGRGTVYASARGGYFVVDLSAGHAARIDVEGAHDTDFTAIARRADGKLLLGSADGAVYLLGAPGAATAAVAKRSKVFARVDSIATQGNTAVVLDRAQSSVTAIGADGTAKQALRAGDGATTMAADPAGRVLVADTRGGQLLVFGVDPLILRQAYPVRQAPYGLAGSGGLAWVSQTAANMVIGYDLTTGIPVEKVRYPTVRQPNLLAFDDASGTLYVVSGSGDGVQAIEHAAGGR